MTDTLPSSLRPVYAKASTGVRSRGAEAFSEGAKRGPIPRNLSVDARRQTAFATMKSCGYGSPLSRGRRRNVRLAP